VRARIVGGYARATAATAAAKTEMGYKTAGATGKGRNFDLRGVA
jgi:hypothetical protein